MKKTDVTKSVIGQGMTVPLSLALSNLDLLCASVEEEIQETVRETRRNVLRMYRAICKYELAEAIRTETLRLSRESHAIAGILERVCAPVKEPAAKRGVEIRTDAPKGLLVCCDAEAVEKVLWNLLENAVNAAVQGGKVIVRAKRTEKGVRVSVEEEGVRFEDGEERIRAAANASGLGISRDLLRMQASTLEYASTEDGHTEFFVLPEGDGDELRCPVPEAPAVFGISDAEVELSALRSVSPRDESSG